MSWPIPCDNRMKKIKVLFICVHNSARSQMAEAWLKKISPDKFEVTSAGLKPGKLNPLVVEVMKEAEIDISKNKTKSVFDLVKDRKHDYVIAVCDESQSARCPVFPGEAKKLYWPFKDPSRFPGSRKDKLEAIRKVRDQIKAQVRQWAYSI